MGAGSQQDMMTIHLENLKFFGYHGLYEIEKNEGNHFEMNLLISFRLPKEIITHIDQTVNYAAVYELVSEEMKRPRELLETFLGELAELIHQKFPQVITFDATLYKLTAPIPDLTGRVGVRLHREF